MNHSKTNVVRKAEQNRTWDSLHPAWRDLIELCEDMGYGEIERLKIHDGLPALAEVTRQKVKLG